MEGGGWQGAGWRAGSWFLVVHGEKKEVIIGDLKFAEEEISNSLKVLINLKESTFLFTFQASADTYINLEFCSVHTHTTFSGNGLEVAENMKAKREKLGHWRRGVESGGAWHRSSRTRQL